ncbi:hypothetical protein [Chryseobacterium vrystaatense]|uniref:Uncharacterized protein n=1 Tax=Chryseobacterium vrystaatense TaxID=307480 RepID=A0ABR4UP03_9FLAO|nr:hypothetical protein [Chryseobacterium vrystaatense]KFF26846.1 hypothetical protein IW16_06070 [Chryseobacterium vrystaatense]
MEVKFFTNSNRILDLSKQKVSVQESNSKVNDKMFSKFMFPFEIYMDEEFINSFGDFDSYETFGLDSKIEGFLLFENYLHEGRLIIESIEGKYLTGQIDFGFEELPNWSKKLSELSLEQFDVSDIHIYAKEICGKKYPQTNFNFPRIYTSKYSPDDKMWDAFNGYYNDLDVGGFEMVRNEVDSAGNIFNKNIIHPCVHFLYLLRKCFQDANLILKGDVLIDSMFENAWVFSGTEYFNKVSQFQNSRNLTVNDYEGYENVTLYLQGGPAILPRYTYRETISLAFNDQIFINGKFHAKVRGQTMLKFVIQINGNNIWQHEKFYSSYEDVTVPFSLNLNVNNVSLAFVIVGFVIGFNEGYNVLEYQLKSKSIVSNTSSQSDDAEVENPNKIDLKRAVPDMTVGEFVNIIRNWFNYEFFIKENVISMNRIGDKEPNNIKNFEVSEIKSPKRNLLQKRSYVLKNTDLEDFKLNSIYFDKDGVTINKEENDNTTVIEINGYPLPVEKRKELSPLTASVKKDSSSVLALVFYNGLDNSGQNNAIAKPQATFPDLFYSNWEKWLRQRVNGSEFNWKFQIPADDLEVKISDYIKCYNNIHIITGWTKDLNEGTYEIDITTETVY